jgi:hypothetical protein
MAIRTIAVIVANHLVVVNLQPPEKDVTCLA